MNLKSLVFFSSLLLFSTWLMLHTFSRSGSNLIVASKVWSDFAASLPLIRSFSKGDNWPLQHPLFPGEPMRYHPLFFILVGLLEKLGLSIDWALNLPSILGFFLLMYFIIRLGKHLFPYQSVAVIALIFFLFNGSFSFIEFIDHHALSPQIVQDLITSTQYTSFGPWDGGIVSAFWNLNIYTNQRHLGLSFALILLVIYILSANPSSEILVRPTRKVVIPWVYLTGFILGLLVFLNQASFLITFLFVLWFFLFRPPLRLPLIFSAIGIIPWVALAALSLKLAPSVIFHLGFLAPQPVTLTGFIRYWIYNFGFHFILIPIGLVIAPPKARILIIPLLLLFLGPNLWQFSPDIINNHKFFNAFLILGGFFSAWVLVRLFRVGLVGKTVSISLFLLLVAGGIVDFFPLKNDSHISIIDLPQNTDAAFFASLPPASVVLNSFWFYHPASLAGRSIYQGYTYFTWSYGYDAASREKSAVQIYRAPSKNEACRLLHNSGISHVELSSHPEEFIQPNWQLWRQEFTPVFISPSTGLIVYSTSADCK